MIVSSSNNFDAHHEEKEVPLSGIGYAASDKLSIGFWKSVTSLPLTMKMKSKK